jgi:hypothetical protein
MKIAIFCSFLRVESTGIKTIGTQIIDSQVEVKPVIAEQDLSSSAEATGNQSQEGATTLSYPVEASYNNRSNKACSTIVKEEIESTLKRKGEKGQGLAPLDNKVEKDAIYRYFRLNLM